MYKVIKVKLDPVTQEKVKRYIDYMNNIAKGDGELEWTFEDAVYVLFFNGLADALKSRRL